MLVFALWSIGIFIHCACSPNNILVFVVKSTLVTEHEDYQYCILLIVSTVCQMMVALVL